MNAMLANHHPENIGINTMPANASPFGFLQVPDINEATGLQRVDARGFPMMRETTWNERWVACSILQRWTPDGVIIGSEHQHGAPIPLAGGMNSNPGDLWNICVQGPTPLKNSYVSPTDFAHAYTQQNIDSGPRVLDKVFVGLFARENRDPATGINRFYSYYWKPFTGRQAMSVDLLAAAGTRAMPAPGSMNRGSGPTNEEFVRLVSAWRMGTIMDNHLTHGRVQLNVIIEEWSLDWIRGQYNIYVGASVALRMRTTGLSLLAAVAVLARIQAVLRSPARNLIGRFQQLSADFEATEDDATSTTDPFGFGAPVSELEREINARLEWEERSKEWTDLRPKQRKEQRLKNPGAVPPPPSLEMRRFFLKMNKYAPVGPLTELFMEKLVDPALGETGASEETEMALLIARAATFAEDEPVYDTLDADQKELVQQARVAAALIAKLRAPIQLFLRIEVIAGLAEWANPQGVPPGAGGDSDDGVSVGSAVDPDDF